MTSCLLEKVKHTTPLFWETLFKRIFVTWWRWKLITYKILVYELIYKSNDIFTNKILIISKKGITLLLF